MTAALSGGEMALPTGLDEAAATAVAAKRVLDPCCGSKMMWFDPSHPDVLFGDLRRERLTVTDNSRGNASGTRTICIEPDTLLDFRALPFADA